MRQLRVVSPYRPFVPESYAHTTLGPFDWVDALRMLRVSVARSNNCETVAITDLDTELPGPTFQYATTERRLMLWILDVALCYLRSDDFDCDTILLSPDLLVFGDLRPWMTEHFTVLMRAKYPAHPILNAVQFWPLQRKATLIRFYEDALTIGRSLPEGYLRWGGDTEPIRRLLAPLAPGLVIPGKIDKLGYKGMATKLACGQVVLPVRAILDFRFTRKQFMRRYFDATIGSAVPA